ncbi:MAG: T9SS type A sorting domain-containing protein [Ignavibacteriae bacterium]|nr:T9SS type A sorting domain-containing protein [Ignavibacteriota bacterium]
MKTVFLFLSFLLLSVSATNAQWNQYQTGVPYSLFAVDFYKANIYVNAVDSLGLAVGEGGTVLRTTDAGEEWTRVYTYNTIWLNDIKWATPTVAYAAGMGGVIIKTVNAGVNWTMSRPYDTPMHTIRGIAVDPSDPLKVTCVGYAGTYITTVNGGSTWNHVHRTDLPWTMHSIDFSPTFVTDGRGIIAGTDGLVWNTTDGGITWVSRNSRRYDYLNDVVFISPINALICGNNGTVILTANWGRTWDSLPSKFTSEHLRSIDFRWGPDNNRNATVCGDNGTIFTSNNWGNPGSWTDVSPGSETRHFYGVCLNGPTIGTVVGEVGTGVGYEEGVMYKTYTNGMVGVSQTGTTVPQKYLLNQNFPNPFNPTTKISFAMARSGPVMLTVFDMTGKEVATLVNTTLSAGNFEYEFDGSKLSSGVYFYRIITNDFVDTKKMSLLK